MEDFFRKHKTLNCSKETPMDPVARQQPQWHFEDEQPADVNTNFCE